MPISDLPSKVEGKNYPRSPCSVFRSILYVRTARVRVWLRVDVGTGAHPSRRRLTTSAAAGEDC